MGTWGAGNFEDDIALDWLSTDVTPPLCETVESGLRNQDELNDHVIMAAVEVLTVLCEQVQAAPPKPEQVVSWRDSYLRSWDGYIDSLEPKADYKHERREVIVATFGRLLAAARVWYSVPLQIEFEEAMPDQSREQLRARLHAALVAEEAGELTAGETFAQPAENDTLTVITGRAFARDAARNILRSALQALNIDSARWITFGDPADESAEVWFTPQPPV